LGRRASCVQDVPVAVGGVKNIKLDEILDIAGGKIRVTPEGKYSS